ncbi:MAG TPA: membrane protein insertion efficiency factor YidD [Dermatophilaceae bacterium]|nr:membrane protein insertion efficiency factor YidD [Dermatophilaceae bacterium]
MSWAAQAAAWVVRLPGLLAVGLIRGYQLVLSPMHPPSCRFYPSCSAYALAAIQRFGLIRGGALAARRLLRCHPWNPGGVDHVPHVGELRARRVRGLFPADPPRPT